MKKLHKNILIICSITSIVFLSGCGTTGVMPYDYSDYSEKYYLLKKEPSKTSLMAWKESMEDIVAIAKEDSLRVPPGIYANLGYLSLKENKTAEAVSYFNLEKNTYPQATVFMNKLIEKTEQKNSGDES